MTERLISLTINTADPQADRFDLVWARGTRHRVAGTVTIQCWGCGGAMTVPDTPLIELPFQHAVPVCSYDLAVANRAAGLMPSVATTPDNER